MAPGLQDAVAGAGGPCSRPPWGESVLDDAVSGEPGDLLARATSDCLAVIQRTGLLADARATVGASRSATLLLRVLVYMCEHAGSRATTVESTAAAHGVTRRYLELTFAKVGETPAGMLRSFRVANARGLLLRGGRPERIGTVAELAGFGSVSSLTRAFRQETGLTPAAWRRHTVHGRGRTPAGPPIDM